jgi:flagellar biosynthesis protein FlhA
MEERMPPDSARIDAAPWTRSAGIILPVTIVGAILVFVVPIPPGILDLCLATNLTLAVLVLLTVLTIRSPQDFSAFPTILLATTLGRLVLNVAVTRLVLTRGGEYGLDAAGKVVRAFGQFVAGDQVIVGAILFGILVIIQFVVITRGATRISEVAARFMLDGLPGRQMAIDADLHAGLIDQHEASRRRDAVYRQADFFGAMDGAGKFVRGDAVAGVLITFVNILGGLYLGVIVHGLSFAEAIDVFTKLTIGDGLVSQVPAFLISLAAGLIVTRSSSPTDLGRDVVGQLVRRPEVLLLAAGFLGLLALTPLPKLPLLALAASLVVGAYLLRGQSIREDDAIDPQPESPPAPEPQSTEKVEDALQVDPLELETGYRLIALSDPTRGDLLERIRGVRQRVARDLGLIVPQVRIRDEIGLAPHEYRLRIRGTVVAEGIAYAGRLLAVPPAGATSLPDGRDAVDPVSGRSAVWIHADGREVAELAGCKVLDAASVVAAHFGAAIVMHASELMTHEQVRRLLDRTRSVAPSLVDEVVPGLLRFGDLRRILQHLLRERVSIRDLETILEALAERAGQTKDLDGLTEYVRRALGRRLVQPYIAHDGRLRAVNVSRPLDARLAALAGMSNELARATMGDETAGELVRAVASAIEPLVDADTTPVVICSADARPVLRDLTRAALPQLAVLARHEVPPEIPIMILGTVVEEELPTVTHTSTAALEGAAVGA